MTNPSPSPSSSDRPTPRREFLGHLATTAAALAGTACVSGHPHPQAAAATPQLATGAGPAGASQAQTARVQWDDSWVSKLTAKHKAMFEAAAVEEGNVLGHAVRYLNGMREALETADGDVQVVLVIRHSAIPMAFNDAMWAKYNIGKQAKIKDGNDWATRNPYLNGRSGGAGRGGDRPTATLAWFGSHGHIMLGCNMATLGWGGEFAQAAGLDSKTVYEDLKANLVPGMILQPNGIYAVHRAQEAGCTFFKSS
jgi:hypothetical protein